MCGGLFRRSINASGETQDFYFPGDMETVGTNALLDLWQGFDTLLVGVNGDRNPSYLSFLQELFGSAVPMAVFLLRSPHDARLVASAPNLWALYEDTPWMAEAGVAAAFGGMAGGRKPVDLFPGRPL